VTGDKVIMPSLAPPLNLSEGKVGADTKLPQGNHILYVDMSTELLGVPRFAVFVFIRKGGNPQKSPVKWEPSIGFHRDSKRVASEIKSHHNPDFSLQLLSKAAKLVSRSTFGASVTPKQVKSFTAQFGTPAMA